MATVLILSLLVATAHGWSGAFFDGDGDDDYVAMLDAARRMWTPDVVLQSVPMVYRCVHVSSPIDTRAAPTPPSPRFPA
jgi:hypothetical protein